MMNIDAGNAEVNVRLMHRDRHGVSDNRGIADFPGILRERPFARILLPESRVLYLCVAYLCVINWSSCTVCECEEIHTLMLFAGNLFGPLLYRAYIICLMIIFVSKIRYANLRAAFARRVYRAITFENPTSRACESSRGDATVRIISAICAM